MSWGVIEVPDWGYQMPAERVLREAAALGLAAMEAGPEGFLPQDPAEVSDLLAGYGLSLVGGFVPAVLHDAGSREAQLALVERRAGVLRGRRGRGGGPGRGHGLGELRGGRRA